VGAGEEPTVLRRGAHRGVTATVAVDQFRHQARHGLGQDTGIAAQEHVVAPTLDMVDGEADDVGRVLAVEKHEQTGNSVAQTDAVIDEQPADENRVSVGVERPRRQRSRTPGYLDVGNEVLADRPT
jgi:hypothetical protein